MPSPIFIAAATAAAFNLNCTGTLEATSIAGKTKEPYTHVYRMDLDKGKWCEGECKALFNFFEIQPSVLVLQRRDSDTPRQREHLEHTIDRETGADSALATSGLSADIVILKWNGECEKANFSGFPALQTKF